MIVDATTWPTALYDDAPDSTQRVAGKVALTFRHHRRPDIDVAKVALLVGDHVRLVSRYYWLEAALDGSADWHLSEMVRAAMGARLLHTDGTRCDSVDWPTLFDAVQFAQAEWDEPPSESFLQHCAGIFDDYVVEHASHGAALAHFPTSELLLAVDEGALTLLPPPSGRVAWGSDRADYASLLDASLRDDSWPMLDPMMEYWMLQGYVQMESDRSGPGPTVRAGANAGSLATRLLSRIPAIQHATVEQVLLLRQDAGDELAAFRSHLLQLVADIRNVPWGSGDAQALEAVFLTKLDPSLADLGRRLEATRWWEAFSRDALVGGAATALAVAAVNPRAGVAAALAGLAVSAQRARADREAAVREARGHPLYFLARVGRGP